MSYTSILVPVPTGIPAGVRFVRGGVSVEIVFG